MLEIPSGRTYPYPLSIGTRRGWGEGANKAGQLSQNMCCVVLSDLWSSVNSFVSHNVCAMASGAVLIHS